MSVKQLQDASAELPKGFLRQRWYLYAIIVVLVLLVLVLATSIGSVNIPFSTTFSILADKLPFVDITPTWSANIETIIFDIRLPRVLMAGLVGAALAIAGATYQGLFRNPLADPYLIGVAKGLHWGRLSASCYRYHGIWPDSAWSRY